MFQGLCDSHAHLTSSALFEQVDDVLARAQAAGVNCIINICTDPSNLEQGLKLAQQYPWVYNAAAVHPHDVEKDGNATFPFIEEAARQKKIVAIGETGLDYHYQHSSREIQHYFLRKHLQLAREYHLPVIIHCREAYHDFFQILDEEYVIDSRHGPGVLHCFTGTIAEAEQGLKRGFYVSLSGIVTFKKSEELREVARLVPLDRLLIETDAPYLAPQSKRGHPNEPSYIVETAAVIASVKGISTAALIEATAKNARTLFHLKVFN